MHVIVVARSQSQEGCGECVERCIVRMSMEIKSIAEEANAESTFRTKGSDFAGCPFAQRIRREQSL
jgi:hypothetical protein